MINVESTLKNLLEAEDTDQNMQITIEDQGPKVCTTAPLPYSNVLAHPVSLGDFHRHHGLLRL